MISIAICDDEEYFRTKDICLVFVTAFITYAPEGYKVNAIRYLLKDNESFENAINY